jgi:selenide,water dikinase
LVHPKQVKRNSGARAGDVLVLGKPLGIGILSAALKKGLLSSDGYLEMLRWTTLLNRAGAEFAKMKEVHAVTDVTGFGLAGHLLEICRGSGLAAEIDFYKLPLITEAIAHAQSGMATGASRRNWASYRREVSIAPACEPWHQTMLTDPQTSGGLLVSCAPSAVKFVLEAFQAHGCTSAAVIGSMFDQAPTMVRVSRGSPLTIRGAN